MDKQTIGCWASNYRLWYPSCRWRTISPISSNVSMLNPSGLQPAHFAIVRRILHTHVPDREVWMFGSRMTAKAKLASDRDLVIVSKQPLPLLSLARLRQVFEESELPFKVDLLDWNRLS